MREWQLLKLSSSILCLDVGVCCGKSPGCLLLQNRHYLTERFEAGADRRADVGRKSSTNLTQSMCQSRNSKSNSEKFSPSAQRAETCCTSFLSFLPLGAHCYFHTLHAIIILDICLLRKRCIVLPRPAAVPRDICPVSRAALHLVTSSTNSLRNYAIKGGDASYSKASGPRECPTRYPLPCRPP